MFTYAPYILNFIQVLNMYGISRFENQMSSFGCKFFIFIKLWKFD